MNDARLIERLRAIEALYAGATTEGEKIAAEQARHRIRERLAASEREDPPVEYRFSMADEWSRKVFVALLRRYGIRPYRYKRQRYTTVMARVSKRFVDETLWPEFQEVSDSLMSYLTDVTNRIVSEVIHADSSEAEVVEAPKLLPGVEGAMPSKTSPESAPKPTTTSTGVEAKVPPGGQEENETRGRRAKKRKRKRRRKRNKTT